MKKLFLAFALSCLLMPASGFAGGWWWGGGGDDHGNANASEMSELGLVGATLIGAAAYLRLRLSRKAK